MGPTATMNNLNASSSSNSTIVAVPKLHDDGCNWADYEPRIQNIMGAKGHWRHVLGTATAPVPYAVSNGVPMLADGKTPATEDQIESKESKIIEFEKSEYLAHHIILSTTSTHLATKIKALKSAEDMWRQVIDNATSKSTLHLLNAEDQLASCHMPFLFVLVTIILTFVQLQDIFITSVFHLLSSDLLLYPMIF